MAWANWLAAAGVTVEFIGFGILAYELVQTNRAAVTEARKLASQKDIFETLMSGSEGTTVKGGLLGAMVENLKSRESELARSTHIIRWGVAVTAAGSLGQVFAAAAQAMGYGGAP